MSKSETRQCRNSGERLENFATLKRQQGKIVRTQYARELEEECKWASSTEAPTVVVLRLRTLLEEYLNLNAHILYLRWGLRNLDLSVELQEETRRKIVDAELREAEVVCTFFSETAILHFDYQE